MTRDPFYQIAAMLRQGQSEYRLVLAELADGKSGTVTANGRQDSLQGYAVGQEPGRMPQGSVLLCLDGPEGLFALCRLVSSEEGA